MSKKVIRTSLTEQEWTRLKLKVVAADTTIEQWATDKLRAALKGAKP